MSSQSFFIGTALPSLNDVIDAAKIRKGKWSLYHEMKVMYESMIKADIKAAKLKPMQGQVSITFHWIERNKKRDIDNVAAGKKFVLDALVAMHILHTDSRFQVIGFHDTFSVDKHKPGVMVTLEEVPA